MSFFLILFFLPSESIFSYGLAGFLYSLAWRHRLSPCLRFFPLFPGISATVSIHLITPSAVLKPGSASSPGVWHHIPVLSRRPLSSKLIFFIPISADKKGATSALGFWPIVRPPSSSCQAIHSDYYMSLYPLLYPSGRRVQHLLAFILIWICYFGREELTYIPYSSFNCKSLTACWFKYGGVGEISYFSPLSGRPRDNSFITWPYN